MVNRNVLELIYVLHCSLSITLYIFQLLNWLFNYMYQFFITDKFVTAIKKLVRLSRLADSLRGGCACCLSSCSYELLSLVSQLFAFITPTLRSWLEESVTDYIDVPCLWWIVIWFGFFSSYNYKVIDLCLVCVFHLAVGARWAPIKVTKSPVKMIEFLV